MPQSLLCPQSFAQNEHVIYAQIYVDWTIKWMNGDKRCHTMKKKDRKDTLNRVCLIPFFLSKKVLFVFRNSDASEARRMFWRERFVGVRHRTTLTLHVPPTLRQKRATLGSTWQMPQHLLVDKNYLFLFLEELKAEYVFHRTIVRVNTKRTRVE